MTRKGNRPRPVGCSMLVVAGLAFAAVASAQSAYTTQAVNVRAGPDREYPQVAWLPAGVSVNVIGCVEGYRWCDIVVGPNRGWVYAQFLSYPYQNQPVTIISGGAILGLPLVTFSIGPYWDNYYRGRPWYGNRAYWYGRPTPYYRPPPQYYQPRPPAYVPSPPRPPVYLPPTHRPPGYVPPPSRPPGYVPPSGGRPPGGRPPPGTGRPPGNPPPSGGRPPGARPPGPGPQPPVTTNNDQQ
jgi:uncharacterized protein YraI